MAGICGAWGWGGVAKKGWDDALDVWACHGVGGIIGSIFVGVFAAKGVNGVSGLVEGNTHQLLVQIAGVAICALYSFAITLVLFKIINRFTPVRVPELVEERGLDTELHGETAYDLGTGLG